MSSSTVTRPREAQDSRTPRIAAMGQLCAPPPILPETNSDTESVTPPPSTWSEVPDPPVSIPSLLVVHATEEFVSQDSSEEDGPTDGGADSDTDGETARLAQEYEDLVAEMNASRRPSGLSDAMGRLMRRS